MHSAIIIIITRDVYFLLCSLGNNFKIQKKVIEVQNRCLPVNFELDPNYDGWTLSEEVHITYICSSRSCSGSPLEVTWKATFCNCHIKTFGNMFLKKILGPNHLLFKYFYLMEIWMFGYYKFLLNLNATNDHSEDHFLQISKSHSHIVDRLSSTSWNRNKSFFILAIRYKIMESQIWCM